MALERKEFEAVRECAGSGAQCVSPLGCSAGATMCSPAAAAAADRFVAAAAAGRNDWKFNPTEATMSARAAERRRFAETFMPRSLEKTARQRKSEDLAGRALDCPAVTRDDDGLTGAAHLAASSGRLEVPFPLNGMQQQNQAGVTQNEGRARRASDLQKLDRQVQIGSIVLGGEENSKVSSEIGRRLFDEQYHRCPGKGSQLSSAIESPRCGENRQTQHSPHTSFYHIFGREDWTTDAVSPSLMEEGRVNDAIRPDDEAELLPANCQWYQCKPLLQKPHKNTLSSAKSRYLEAMVGHRGLPGLPSHAEENCQPQAVTTQWESVKELLGGGSSTGAVGAMPREGALDKTVQVSIAGLPPQAEESALKRLAIRAGCNVIAFHTKVDTITNRCRGASSGLFRFPVHVEAEVACENFRKEVQALHPSSRVDFVEKV